MAEAATSATTDRRRVAGLFPCVPTKDGSGVRIRRVIGTRRIPEIDPFLLFDEFGSDDPNAYIGGFPDHPHRGFETVTYMLAGRMRHKDNKGHEGVLEPGSVQWMTAGRGIIHSEMPEQSEGLMRGFQLWVNLPAARKMSEPRYQEFAAVAIPSGKIAPGVTAKVIAGRLGAISGPVEGIAIAPLYADVRFAAGAVLDVAVPVGHRAVVYAFEGEARVADRNVAAGTLAVLTDDGKQLQIEGGGDGASVMLIAAAPIGEPIARHGPFVMNTREEIEQALEDYYGGRL